MVYDGGIDYSVYDIDGNGVTSVEEDGESTDVDKEHLAYLVHGRYNKKIKA